MLCHWPWRWAPQSRRQSTRRSRAGPRRVPWHGRSAHSTSTSTSTSAPCKPREAAATATVPWGICPNCRISLPPPPPGGGVMATPTQTLSLTLSLTRRAGRLQEHAHPVSQGPSGCGLRLVRRIALQPPTCEPALRPHCDPTAAPLQPHCSQAARNPTLPATRLPRFLQPHTPRARLARYDIYNACNTLWGKELVEMIKNREGRLVVRPDSGDPPVIVCEVRQT